MWLLAEPQLLHEREGWPQRDGPLRLRHGPERIESQWWETHDVARDYYHAIDVHGIAVWVFRERQPPHRWFLHGLSGMSASPPAYAELHCLTHFTFLRGASRPAELVQRAQQLGYGALAITDECSVAGVVRAHMAVQNPENGAQSLQLIIGAEFTLTCGLRFVALVTNRHGYARLCALITHGRRAAPKGSYQLTREEVQRHLEDCLILWLPGAVPEAAQLQWLSRCFAGNLWIAVELLLGGHRSGVPGAADGPRRRVWGTAGGQWGCTHAMCGRGRRLQDAVTAIRHGVTLAQAGGPPVSQRRAPSA